jgi:hypothetical protein
MKNILISAGIAIVVGGVILVYSSMALTDAAAASIKLRIDGIERPTKRQLRREYRRLIESSAR